MGRTWKIGERAASGDVVVAVDRDGVAVMGSMREAVRLDFTMRIAAAGCAVPGECGDAIPAAPARGRLRTFEPVEMVPNAKGGYRRQSAGYLGRSGAMVEDVWDRMERQARAAHARLGRDAGSFDPPFTPGQVAVGRDYAALTERCAASGVKCSSLEAARAAASGGGDREAAIFRDFSRLRSFHRRIGIGLAKEMRRFRPQETRRAIRVRSLVDMVCLGDKALSEVLAAHGWAAKGESVDALRAALCGALDRMQGYEGDLVRDID